MRWRDGATWRGVLQYVGSHVLFGLMDHYTTPGSWVAMRYSNDYKGTWYSRLTMDKTYAQHAHNVGSGQGMDATG